VGLLFGVWVGSVLVSLFLFLEVAKLGVNTFVEDWFSHSKDENWSVWVGGGEVNLCLLSASEALNLAMEWVEEGYDDVWVQDRFDNEPIKFEVLLTTTS